MNIEVKTKNGYVKIANNLFDNIIFRDFNNRERAVIFLVIRLSYGFNHKAAIIKPKARFGLIGMHRQHIDRALDSLIAKNVIIDRGNDEFMLNKHFDTWKVKLNKHFNEDNFNELKGLQFRGNVTTTVTDSNQNENSQVTATVTNFENCNHHGYNEVTTTVTKNETLSPPRLHEQAENIDSESDITTPKDIIKDNIKTCIKDIYIEGEEKKVTKNFDPYFNNPIVEKFKKEYEKIFDKKRCYLDNFQINKLIEISADNPDFIEKIPEILEKYRKIEFSNGISKFGLKGLINEGKWAGILNGEYDNYIKNKDSQNSSFDLGIPVWSDD